MKVKEVLEKINYGDAKEMPITLYSEVGKIIITYTFKDALENRVHADYLKMEVESYKQFEECGAVQIVIKAQKTNNLQRLRFYNGLSQAQLAEQSEVSIRTIQKYESGELDIRKAQAITVYQLAQALQCTVEDLIKPIKRKGKMNMMNNAKYESLKNIKTIDDVAKNAKYYSEEYERAGNNHYSYTNFYDEQFEMIESAKVIYTNSIAHLTRIVADECKNDLALSAYTIEEIGNGFCYVVKNEHTSAALKSVINSVKPDNWK